MRDTGSLYNLARLAGYYNSGEVHIFGFCRFAMQVGSSSSYPTSRSAIIVPLSGQGEFRFNGQVFRVSRGTLLHGCPNRLLTISNTGELPFEYAVMYYENKEELLFSCELPKAEQVYPLLNLILDASSGNELSDKFKETSLTDEFLDLIFSEVIPPSVFAEQQFVQTLSDYIREHCSEPITLQALADHAGESKARISYLFYKHYHARPIDYLINCRMEQAVRLLHDGASVGQAAKAVGYSDALYFSRIFKRRLGFAPSELKRRD